MNQIKSTTSGNVTHLGFDFPQMWEQLQSLKKKQ